MNENEESFVGVQDWETQNAEGEDEDDFENDDMIDGSSVRGFNTNIDDFLQKYRSRSRDQFYFEPSDGEGSDGDDDQEQYRPRL